MKATTRRTGLLSLLSLLLTSAVLAGCDKASMGPDAERYTWAGVYATGQKWGGASGTWRDSGDLEILDDRRVIYRGTEIVNPQVGDASVSWSMADGNATNASFTLMDSSDSVYYWGHHGAAGRLFQGWIQYPREGKLDYRGKMR